MKKAIASGLIGLIALGGGAALAAPSAFAQVDDDGTTRQERIEQREERLDALVESGTITQQQADDIRARFEAKAERRAEKLDLITSTLGVTADDLRAAHDAGQSLADVAAEQGVPVDTLIDALVAQANANLDAKVADGSIDADRAAQISENLEERITARVNGERPEGREGRRGFGGPRGFGGNGPAGLGEA